MKKKIRIPQSKNINTILTKAATLGLEAIAKQDIFQSRIPFAIAFQASETKRELLSK